ncbi:MAG: DUF1080 domain-containing protein [Gemmataceae bacterium]|nr:DUF1080 domain-containing protein [Gemmataceae bacterium]
MDRRKCLLALAAFPGILALAKEPLPEGPGEKGVGLTQPEAAQGWLSLIDLGSSFGWDDARRGDGALLAGQFGLPLNHCKIRLLSRQGAAVALGKEVLKLEANKPLEVETGKGLNLLRVQEGMLNSAAILPLGLEKMFNGKNLDGWKEITRKNPSPATWEVKEGALYARGGPAAMEWQGPDLGDFILRIRVESLARYANGGLFFRSIRGDFMNGYEAQIYSRCEDNDACKPSKWATGAIDDRQQARRLVSRDFEPFTMTVIAKGPRLGIWVNGYQTVDWIDTRSLDDNPRKGRREKPGAIQVQAHDPLTDLRFLDISARPFLA